MYEYKNNTQLYFLNIQIDIGVILHFLQISPNNLLERSFAIQLVLRKDVCVVTINIKTENVH
jgi:hypothetical protein